MEYTTLLKQQVDTHDKKLTNQIAQFDALINALKAHDVPDVIKKTINQHIEDVNLFTGKNKEISKQIRRSQTHILKVVEKELKLVPKGHNRNIWMALGMSAFGIPLGTVFGLALDNLAFLGIGLPIGLALGIGIGTSLDNKAKAEGRQLDVDIKY